MSCPSCGRVSSAHSLDDARACLDAIAKAEPSYCRLTGPSDTAAWRAAVAAHARGEVSDRELIAIRDVAIATDFIARRR